MAKLSNMANVRDSDTSLWLHNKLGTSNDLWSGGSICSQLSQDVLRNIKECFIDLQAQVKLKLLLSFLHIPRRNTEEWKVELEEILELAVVDSDQWVSMLAELLKSYPSCGTVNMEIEENARVFTDLLTELRKYVKKHSELGMIPMECLYLNKNALSTIVGQQPQQVKHFTLKRKPKSAALRAELLQKSSDAANNPKKNAFTPGVPIRSRSLAKRMDDTTPLKGFCSRTPTNTFRSPPAGVRRIANTPTLPPRPTPPKTPAGRKDGGIKLLDITEQPHGFGREAKRRKKLAEETSELMKKEKEAAAGMSPNAASTPEYAAGLISTTSLTPQIPSTLTTPQSSITTPISTTPFISTNATSLLSIPTMPTSIATPAATPPTPLSTATVPARENLQQTVQVQTTRIQVISQAASTPNAVVQPPLTATLTSPQTPTKPAQAVVQVVNPQQQQPTIVQTIMQPQQGPPKKGLSLTREQMQEAQEMFRTANKVTRPEKALILGFMAGARDNPCPHLGNIVTIKLSENLEDVTQADGSTVNMMVEMHFQMNYTTGEWKRVKKFKKPEE